MKFFLKDMALLAVAAIAVIAITGCDQPSAKVVAGIDGYGLSVASLAWEQVTNKSRAADNSSIRDGAGHAVGSPAIDPIHDPIGQGPVEQTAEQPADNVEQSMTREDLANEIKKHLASADQPMKVSAPPPVSDDDQPITVPVTPEPERLPPEPQHVNPPLAMKYGPIPKEPLGFYTLPNCPPCKVAEPQVDSLGDRFQITKLPPPAWFPYAPAVHWNSAIGPRVMVWPGLQEFLRVYELRGKPSKAFNSRHVAHNLKPHAMCPAGANTALDFSDIANKALDLIGTGEVRMNSWYSITIPADTQFKFSRSPSTLTATVSGNSCPRLRLHAAGLGYSANIRSAKLTREKVVVQIESFPDVTFSIDRQNWRNQ